MVGTCYVNPCHPPSDLISILFYIVGVGGAVWHFSALHSSEALPHSFIISPKHGLYLLLYTRSVVSCRLKQHPFFYSHSFHTFISRWRSWRICWLLSRLHSFMAVPGRMIRSVMPNFMRNERSRCHRLLILRRAIAPLSSPRCRAQL